MNERDIITRQMSDVGVFVFGCCVWFFFFFLFLVFFFFFVSFFFFYGVGVFFVDGAVSKRQAIWRRVPFSPSFPAFPLSAFHVAGTLSTT